MIVTEYYMTRPDGVALNITYSSGGYMIEKVSDGTRYVEAIDPADSGREYIETDERIDQEEETAAENIVDILLGQYKWPQ